MATKDFATAMIFLSQTTVGIMANFSLLYHYIFLYFKGCKSRSTDLILRHLTIANSLVILFKGIPETMAAFGWKDVFNNFACKLVFYVHRVSRGVSFGSICLLSIFQAITMSPINSRWAKLKVKAPKYIGFSSVLCWILHMLVNIVFPLYLTTNWSNKTITNKKDYGYCSAVRHDKTTDSLYALLLAFPDVVCLGLMLWASGSMVFILQRHKQRVQHIHRNNVSPRSSPETRATQGILALVSTFVCFYTLSSILAIFVGVFSHLSWWLMNLTALTAACFPTVSPFVLMSYDSSVSMFCFSRIRKKKSPHLGRNTCVFLHKLQLFVY
ncbi:vomeronasal type-1 receptor 4-like [Elephas maximus indicus]|uniref:vomeronasal type-1 receptor 4-like n=1 Tax=Elephas maximus indicus TaxID=99487 RepID=UPI002116AD48|nr:vomeronasal type-1 receptor 4-like [Elephas maximus indicus]